ncbi:MAG TPA: tRNA 4-thiouridine(8) synthase ThiI [Firmicutes bacterium]|nr:tRNA 4-thiouridine(8) synthase ThiI [Bacillota bacterium]
MTYNKMLLRFGEVGLKGKNRAFFIRGLAANVRRALSPLGPGYRVSTPYGRIFVDLPSDFNLVQIVPALERVFGLVSFSPVVQTELNMEAIGAAALNELLADGQPETFKVAARRSLKSFELNSMEINRELGGFLLDSCPGLKVDLHKPQRVVNVEVRQDGAYVFSRVFPGSGGLPVGVTGRGVLLLSGGIDSPVAGWMAMKRGISLEAVYFDTPPFTSPRALAKVEKLANILAQWAPVNLHVVNFTSVQRSLMENVPEDLTITIMRRFMFRVAEELARRRGALALITGENVGQVASQTLESMLTINSVVSLPVLRPVVALDKVEIMDISRRIGTYNTSIEPFQDCCTLFVSSHPKTRPTLAQAAAAEEHLDINQLVAQALEGIESRIFKGH